MIGVVIEDQLLEIPAEFVSSEPSSQGTFYLPLPLSIEDLHLKT